MNHVHFSTLWILHEEVSPPSSRFSSLDPSLIPSVPLLFVFSSLLSVLEASAFDNTTPISVFAYSVLFSG